MRYSYFAGVCWANQARSTGSQIADTNIWRYLDTNRLGYGALPFMHFRMTIGKNHASALPWRLPGNSVKDVAGSIGICRIDIEKRIIIAIGVFIRDYPAVGWPRVVEIAQFFGL